MFKEGTDFVPVEPDAVSSEDEAADRLVSPNNLEGADAEAYAWLEQAMSRLLRGHHKAAVEFACDAVNRIALTHDVHGYATY